jgi:hypothetical protein
MGLSTFAYPDEVVREFLRVMEPKGKNPQIILNVYFGPQFYGMVLPESNSGIRVMPLQSGK